MCRSLRQLPWSSLDIPRLEFERSVALLRYFTGPSLASMTASANPNMGNLTRWFRSKMPHCHVVAMLAVCAIVSLESCGVSAETIAVDAAIEVPNDDGVGGARASVRGGQARQRLRSCMEAARCSHRDAHGQRCWHQPHPGAAAKRLDQSCRLLGAVRGGKAFVHGVEQAPVREDQGGDPVLGARFPDRDHGAADGAGAGGARREALRQPGRGRFHVRRGICREH